jgi:hypothetical protein
VTLDLTRLQPVLFDWEEAPRLRVVRVASGSAQAGDPVRVTVAGVEVEGRIGAIESVNPPASSSAVASSSVGVVKALAGTPGLRNREAGAVPGCEDVRAQPARQDARVVEADRRLQCRRAVTWTWTRQERRYRESTALRKENYSHELEFVGVA